MFILSVATLFNNVLLWYRCCFRVATVLGIVGSFLIKQISQCRKNNAFVFLALFLLLLFLVFFLYLQCLWPTVVVQVVRKISWAWY